MNWAYFEAQRALVDSSRGPCERQNSRRKRMHLLDDLTGNRSYEDTEKTS